MSKRDPKLFDAAKEVRSSRAIRSKFMGFCKDCGLMQNEDDHGVCPKCGGAEITQEMPAMKEFQSANKYGAM